MSLGGIPTGPVKPPFAHPEFQGSVPAKWMDRGSGYLRGKPVPHADVSDGYNGVARRGFGPFAMDASYRVYEEGLRRTKQFPGADHRIAPWGDHPQEMRWKPSRRKLEDHEFLWRVGPGTGHGGLLAHINEPESISKRPPFIDKTGTKALPEVYDAEVDRCKQKVVQKVLSKRRRAALAEDRWERTQVLQLEAWERSHLNRCALGGLSSSTTALGNKSLSDGTATAPRRPQRSQSEAQFTRQRS